MATLSGYRVCDKHKTLQLIPTQRLYVVGGLCFLWLREWIWLSVGPTRLSMAAFIQLGLVKELKPSTQCLGLGC